MKKKHGKKHSPSKSSLKKEIVRHVKEDEKDFKKEVTRDKSLLKRVDKPKKHHSKHKDPKPKTKAGKRNKVKIVMKEFHQKKLRSGSKHGPLVTNPKQALAIGYSEQRKENKAKSKRK